MATYKTHKPRAIGGTLQIKITTEWKNFVFLDMQIQFINGNFRTTVY